MYWSCFCVILMEIYGDMTSCFVFFFQIFRLIRDTIGRRNLAAKTLVDKRFLIWRFSLAVLLPPCCQLKMPYSSILGLCSRVSGRKQTLRLSANSTHATSWTVAMLLCLRPGVQQVLGCPMPPHGVCGWDQSQPWVAYPPGQPAWLCVCIYIPNHSARAVSRSARSTVLFYRTRSYLCVSCTGFVFSCFCSCRIVFTFCNE